MVKQYRIMLIVCALLLLGMMGLARAEGSPEVSSPNLGPEQWVGHTFIFLDLPADKRPEGYDIYLEDQVKQGFQGDRTARIPYNAHVGKRVTVTNVVRNTTGDYRDDYIIYLNENDTGIKLVGRTMSGQMESMVLEADLLKAREQFLGKTVYTKRRILQGAFDPRMNAVPAAIMTKIGGAAQVVDVYAGIQAVEPVWLIVTVDGQKAILPIAYSWTNMPVNAWTQSPPWQEELFTEDPRVTLGWSEALWQQIESGIVQEGMTKDQVRLSWGPPAVIHNDIYGSGKTVWDYGTKVLRFTGDSLTSVESVELKQASIP